MDKEKLKLIALKHGIPFIEEILLELAFPLLEEAVKKSDNKIDDAVLALLEQPMKDAIPGLLEKLK